MKLRNFKRHGKEGLKNLGRNGWMTFASVSSVTVALLLVGFFMALMLNLNFISTQIKGDVAVKAYIQRTATDDQIDQLKEEIQSLPLVATVEFIPKEQGLENLIDSMSHGGEDAPVLADLRDENPLPDSFKIKGKTPEDAITIKKAVEGMDFVTKAKYGDGKGTIKNLFNVTDTARNVGLALIIGLLFTTVFLIGNTIKLTIVSRRREIEIMKLVGATNGFIRLPFFVEGLLLGVLGSVLPIALLIIAYRAFYDIFYQNYEMTFIELIPLNPTIYYLCGGVLLIGALIGVWGSVTSVRKFLKV
ncbi:MAG TPA: permease-like cell division protein FtsX [Bacillales bacterium]|nr:permease-like cell division protein FtsX [Bacillales bacterium]